MTIENNFEGYINSNPGLASPTEILEQWIPSNQALPRFTPIDEQAGLEIEFPVWALGKTAAETVSALVQCTQAPVALCAQSVLGVMSLVASMKADIESIQGQAMPVAVYLMTVAKSGERKSAADRHTSAGIFAFQKRLVELGQEGLSPELIFSEPTFEALVDRLQDGPGAGIVLNDDAASLFGSHAMSKEKRKAFIAGLCSLYSGQTINCARASRETKPLSGKPLSVHLMFQPYLVPEVFGDRELCEQGILPRVLPAFPPSTMGTRKFVRPSEEAKNTLAHFHRICLDMLTHFYEQNAAFDASDDPFAHQRALITLSEPAIGHLADFYNEIESAIGPGGNFEPIASFATRATENATRLAGIMSIFDNPDSNEVSLEAAEAGTDLAKFYLASVRGLRSFADAGNILGGASELAKWLVNNFRPGDLLYSQQILQRGPSKYRSKAELAPALRTLVDRGWLVEQEGGTVVDGKPRKQAFQLHPDARV